MVPLVTGKSPSTQFRNVVFPQPLGPTMHTNSPCRTSRFTASNASSLFAVRRFTYSRRTFDERNVPPRLELTPASPGRACETAVLTSCLHGARVRSDAWVYESSV